MASSPVDRSPRRSKDAGPPFLTTPEPGRWGICTNPSTPNWLNQVVLVGSEFRVVIVIHTHSSPRLSGACADACGRSGTGGKAMVFRKWVGTSMAIQTEPSRRFGPKRKALIAAGITAAVLGSTGFTPAYAAIPGPNGVITACYLRTSGAVRLIDPLLRSCKADRESGHLEPVHRGNWPRRPGRTNGSQGFQGRYRCYRSNRRNWCDRRNRSHWRRGPGWSRWPGRC